MKGGQGLHNIINSWSKNNKERAVACSLKLSLNYPLKEINSIIFYRDRLF